MMKHYSSNVRLWTILLSVVLLLFISPADAGRGFKPLPRNYPHPVSLFYNTAPLLCSRGSVGWANMLLAYKDLPPGAAGGVVHAMNNSQVLLWWEHPIFDPVNKRYVINMFAQSMTGPARFGRRLAALVRPLNKPRSKRGFGGQALYIGGNANQSGDSAFIDIRWSIFTRTPGVSVDLFFETEYCPNWLATYTFENPNYQN